MLQINYININYQIKIVYILGLGCVQNDCKHLQDFIILNDTQ